MQGRSIDGSSVGSAVGLVDGTSAGIVVGSTEGLGSMVAPRSAPWLDKSTAQPTGCRGFTERCAVTLMLGKWERWNVSSVDGSMVRSAVGLVDRKSEGLAEGFTEG